MCVSSLMPSLARHGEAAVPRTGEVPDSLLAVLAGVVDPRARRGVRHPLATILAIAVCAVLAGARSYVAIAEWCRDLGTGVRVRLGLALRRPPSESAIRRALQRVDADALDTVLSGWLAERVRDGTPGEPVVVAVDGKSARGARTDGDRRVHLLGALHTGTGVVLGQTVVDGKTNEINAFAPLLDRVPIAGAIVTADALHTQVKHVDSSPAAARTGS